MLSIEEKERYNRHLILPEIGLSGQEKIKNAKVLIIGAGGLGCPVLQYLTAAGVGKIGICDYDYVDISNLQRQILYSNSDLGKKKAIIASEKLARINPYVDFVVHDLMLKKTNVLELFSDYDIIIDCSDNFPTRFLINDACVLLGKPLVFGAIYKFEGQVSVFNFNNGPTYRCLVPEEPGTDEAPSCSQIGVLGAIPGLIGSYQAIEAIKIIIGAGNVLSGKMLIIDTLSMNHGMIEFSRSEKATLISELGEYGDFCNDQYADVEQITAMDLFEQLKSENFKLIDIREMREFDSYRIESVNVPINQLMSGNFDFTNSGKIVLICENGINSLALIQNMKQNKGIENLINLKGGIQAWIQAGFPIVGSTI